MLRPQMQSNQRGHRLSVDSSASANTNSSFTRRAQAPVRLPADQRKPAQPRSRRTPVSTVTPEPHCPSRPRPITEARNSEVSSGGRTDTSSYRNRATHRRGGFTTSYKMIAFLLARSAPPEGRSASGTGTLGVRLHRLCSRTRGGEKHSKQHNIRIITTSL